MDLVNLRARPGYSGFRTGIDCQAYNEPAFRHFLAIERRRAELAMQPVLLVLVAVRLDPGIRNLPEGTAAALFRALGESVREVDFVGWLREGRIAGAVLAQGTVPTSDRARQLMADRVLRQLRKRLSASHSRRLRVRVVRLVSAKFGEKLDPPVAHAASN